MFLLHTSDEDSGKKIEIFLQERLPKISLGAIFKAIRKKDVKVNETRIKMGYILSEGDIIKAYIDDKSINTPLSTQSSNKFSIFFEDENIVIVNKSNLIETCGVNSVESIFRQTNPDFSFAHRLDRQTCGLVLGSKNLESNNELISGIKFKKIDKYYLTCIIGTLPENEGTITSYFEKDTDSAFVKDFKTYKEGRLTAITKYKVLSEYNGLSLVFAKTVTGRTHQLRVHFKSLNHPILGDGKYGDFEKNKELSQKKQLLACCKLIFKEECGFRRLSYLKKKSFVLKDISFLNLFPNFNVEVLENLVIL